MSRTFGTATKVRLVRRAAAVSPGDVSAFLRAHRGTCLLSVVAVAVIAADAAAGGSVPLAGLAPTMPLLCAAISGPVCTAVMSGWCLAWLTVFFLVVPGGGGSTGGQANAADLRGWAVRAASVAVFGVAAVLSSARRRREVARAYAGLEDRVRSRTQELAASQERFRNVFQEAPIGMALVRLDDQRVVRVNPALCAILRRDEAWLREHPLPAVIHPDDLAEHDRWFVKARAGCESFRWEPRCVRSDGQLVWTSVHASVMGDAGQASQLVIVQLVDVSEQHRHEALLAHLAAHDPLTGLLNRHSFLAALDEHIARISRYGVDGAVLMVDLDGFKRINDTFGHSVGDEVIVRIGQLLRQRLRAGDVLARLGGDEFVVLLARGGAEAAQAVAHDVVEQLATHPLQHAGRRLAVTASVGAAVFDGRRRSATQMLIDADLAMYEAKDRGRNQFTLFAPERYDVPGATGRLAWIDTIEAALREDGFVLHAQPVVDLRTRQVVHHEMLLRLPDGSGALVSPGTFMDVAERFGLSRRIDHWVLDRTARILGSAHRAGRRLTLAANVSGHSLADGELLDRVAVAHRREGFPAEDLVLEVTETAAVAGLPQARAFTEQLRDAGHRIALDDFGAGFGSFSYLKHLAFDFIKIDSEFVAGCLSDRTDQVIIDALVDLSRHLGKRTIAEYVESEPVARYLAERGVDLGQGYLFGQPAPMPGTAGRTPAPGVPVRPGAGSGTARPR